MRYYESDSAVNQYLFFHYGGRDAVSSPNLFPKHVMKFHERCAEMLIKGKPYVPHRRALDLGCAVGRASFELSRVCGTVIGVDLSRRFIRAAKTLQKTGKVTVNIPIEGRITKTATLRIPKGSKPACIKFICGDAERVQESGPFDFVIAANLMDRLKNPRQFLGQMGGLVKSGGRLLLTSPYTWSDEYTPQSKWLGGFLKQGKQRKPVRTSVALREILSKEFNLLNLKNIPFVIREHERKYQWCVAHATLWERRKI